MLTDKHICNGVVHRVAWHFDSRFFSYKGEKWEIVWNESGSERGLDNVIYTIRRKSDGHEERYSHKALVKILLEEMKTNAQHIERRAKQTAE